jgi:hypothetical protein
MRPWFGFASFLASIALVVPAAPAAAYCRLTTESPSTSEAANAGCVQLGEKLIWRQRCISYTLVPSDRLAIDVDAIRDTVDASFRAWTSLHCSSETDPFPVVLGQTEELGECTLAEYNRFGPNANTVVFVTDWASRGKDYVPEAYGLTLVWHDPATGEILDADIQINLNRGAITLCGAQCEPGSNQVDLQNVLTHEAGHFLGLAHSQNPAATMYGDAPVGQTTKRDLDVDDVGGMCEIYGGTPVPDCESSDFAPRRGFTATCVEPIEPSGCAIRPAATDDGALGLGTLLMTALALATRNRLAPRRLGAAH